MIFAGRTAFVTGGASGIGRATAESFAKEGANVVVMDFQPGLLADAVASIEASGGIILGIEGDVRDPEAVTLAVDAATERFGGIDIAFNNAGIIDRHSPLTETSLDQFRAVMETNLFGVINCLKVELSHMEERGSGVIVNTASASGLRALPGIASYVTSKHALVGLTRAVALEAAPKGIRVNCICPGFVETPLTSGLFEGNPEAREEIVAQHPPGWICQPGNVADVVLWLCSNRSAYVYGAAVSIDGGLTAM